LHTSKVKNGYNKPNNAKCTSIQYLLNITQHHIEHVQKSTTLTESDAHTEQLTVP